MHPSYILPLALLAASLTSAASVATTRPLPQIDLGYEIHQAISFNDSSTISATSRYAQPPTGELRFKAPVAPTGRNTTVQNGAQGRICPQALPLWNPIGVDFSAAYIHGNATAFILTQAEAALAASLVNTTTHVPGPMETEDCLFLDVFVPRTVYDNRNNATSKKAAVLLEIYGGGYVLGSKGGSTSGNPSGLIKASQAGGGDGIVFVQINYRLGALGWLSGPTLEAAGGVSNAGLYDQRLAIDWVAKYAHLFGGDGTNITLIGESAGGGSIIHQITAFGGQKAVSFQGAIAQSPAWFPILSTFRQENITDNFLALLNVSTIAKAREASPAAVISASFNQILYSEYGEYTYGPAVDGIFVPANPGVLLEAGAFSKDIKIMTGFNTHEGVEFTNPSVRTNAQAEVYLRTRYPGISDQVISYILNTLYPAVYDGSQPYTTPIDRTIFLITESCFTCNTNQLARAFGNKTYAYQFEVGAALHGFDVDFTFYNGQGSDTTAIPPLIAPVAEVLQGYITNFVQTGDPNGVGLPIFPMYQSNGTEVGLNVTIDSYMADPTNNERCVFWGKALEN